MTSQSSKTNPSVFYVATATGGLWKTISNGTTWETLFQDEDVVSIGDVAISRRAMRTSSGSEAGENNNRQSLSWGDGVYKSIDGGSYVEAEWDCPPAPATFRVSSSTRLIATSFTWRH